MHLGVLKLLERMVNSQPVWYEFLHLSQTVNFTVLTPLRKRF